jgi:hypothetical protein|tara:strand:+ start:401 stop:517 length:117 start_codon:yes stop_codon:yes gene_type:complete
MKKKLLKEVEEKQIRAIIRNELARIFFDLFRKRSTWEK